LPLSYFDMLAARDSLPTKAAVPASAPPTNIAAPPILPAVGGLGAVGVGLGAGAVGVGLGAGAVGVGLGADTVGLVTSFGGVTGSPLALSN